MNTLNLIGRLTRDPQHSSTNGRDRTWFTVAVPRGGDSDATDFISVTCFAGTAKAVAQYVSKGHRVAVTGRLRSSTYDRDGETVYALEVIANRVEFLEPRPNKGTSPEPAYAGDEEPF